jgi:hypothetical protein
MHCESSRKKRLRTAIPAFSSSKNYGFLRESAKNGAKISEK